MIDPVYELCRLRNGEDGAAANLRQYFLEALVYDTNPTTWGPKFEAVASAIDQLATNAVESQDVEKYIRACMSRQLSEHFAEIGEELPIPKSTRSSRKKKGLPAPEAPRRHTASIDDGKGRSNGDDDYLDVGGWEPDRDESEVDSDLRDELDLTDDEEAVIDLAQAGYKESGIATRLRIPESQVRRVLRELQQRAKRLGY